MQQEERVTIKEVYEIVGRIESKVDKQLCDIDSRVKSIELWKASILGSFAILAAIFTFVFNILSGWVQERMNR